MSEAGTWCLIESDPGVFSELIADLGVKSAQVEELYSLDQDSLDALKPVYGLIFLFKWTGEKDARPVEPEYGTIFFAQQVITNACATQAILSVLLNNQELDIGTELKNFKDFTKDFDAETKGWAISNSEKIKTVHNSFARAEALSFDDNKKGGKKEDAFHFISYLPINGHVYELDGLKGGPIKLGPCTQENWLATVAPIIEERMARYQQGSSEIRFNLMAIVKDRAVAIEEAIAQIDTQLAAIEVKLNGTAMDTGESGPSADELATTQFQLQEEKSNLLHNLKMEQTKRLRYAKENERRKHNFIPLIINLLTLLAEKGNLVQLAEKSKTKPEGSKKTGN